MNRFNGAVVALGMVIACAGVGHSARASEVVKPLDNPAGVVDIWVNEAPLTLVVDQLAKLSGLQASIDASLQGDVSGTFKGSVDAALSQLATEHDVLFDVRSGTLSAVSRQAEKTAAVAVTNPTAMESFQEILSQFSTSPGNSVEYKSGAVHVVGHPDYVARTTTEISETLADYISQPAPPAAANPLVDDAASDTLEFVGNGLQSEPERSLDATVSKPIQWVTDIPGFDTF